MSTTAPTEEVWNYFLNHKDNIRDCVETFLSIDQWQSMVGPFGDKSEYSMLDFDKALNEKDVEKLSCIMNDAWGRAPENTQVYRILGFTEMCNLLDETIPGFLGAHEEDGIYEFDNEVPF